ncbi:hypothetical protein D3C86_1291260 [compost metagenome]
MTVVEVIGDVVADGVEHAAGEDVHRVLVIDGDGTGEEERQPGVGEQRRLQLLSVDTGHFEGLLGDDVELAAVTGEELHLAKQLAVALQGAELKAAAVHGSVTHGDTAVWHQHQIPKLLPLAHQRLSLAEQAPLGDAGLDHPYDQVVAGLPVRLEASLEKGFELHGEFCAR